MRKLFALLLALVMVVSLSACGSGDDNKTPSSDNKTPSNSQQQEQNIPDTNEGEDKPEETPAPDTSEQKQPEDSDKETPSGGDWPTEGLAALVPAPGFDYMIVGNYDTVFSIVYEDAAEDDVNAYIEEVKAAGFNVDEKNIEFNGKYTFQAYNAEGYWVSIGAQVMEIQTPAE